MKRRYNIITDLSEYMGILDKALDEASALRKEVEILKRRLEVTQRDADTFRNEVEKMTKEKKGKLITGETVSQMLNVSNSQITKMRHSGKLKAVLIGKRWMYPEEFIITLKTRVM